MNECNLRQRKGWEGKKRIERNGWRSWKGERRETGGLSMDGGREGREKEGRLEIKKDEPLSKVK